MTNSKQKGNSFERTIANQLSERFAAVTGVEKGFRRATDSGAFFGGTNISRTETHLIDKATFGDIVCPPDFKFNIEAKHYKSPPPLNAILKGKVSQWDKWISQSIADSAAAGKQMLLIIRYNNTETMSLVPEEVLPNGVITYRGCTALPLTTLLEEPDNFFFE